MSLNNTYFETKGKDVTNPIPVDPGYIPPLPPTPPTPEPGSTPNIPRPTFSGEVSVTFYINESEPNRVSKVISIVSSETITIKEPCSIFSPVIYINTSSDLTSVNYMQMGGRYYFAKVTMLPGNLYMIEGKSDPLMTFGDQIRNNTALLARSQSMYNRYLPDNKVKLNAYEQVKILEFTSGFSKTQKYYLITIGGAS